MAIEYPSKLIGTIEEVDIRDIVISPNSLRSIMDNLEGLIESISKIGLLQPIVVRVVDDHFELIAGVQRFNACRKLGWRKIACHMVELDDKNSFEVSLIENIQRKSLSILQEGMAFKKYVSDFGWGSVSELAKKISKSPSYVSKRIRLLELPSEVINLVSESEIDVSTAQELLTIKDKQEQENLALMIKDGHLTSRNVRQLVNHLSYYHKKTEMILEPELYTKYCSEIEQQDNLLKSIDKAIIALKIAVRKLITVIDNNEKEWILYEILMHHKSVLVAQIDLLIKERKKAKMLFSLRYMT